VLSGSGVLETEQGSNAFGPGSVFHFPAHAWHAAVFDGETVLIETNSNHERSVAEGTTAAGRAGGLADPSGSGGRDGGSSG
jgi:quercetin dioxygenase-like cupin family protein